MEELDKLLEIETEKKRLNKIEEYNYNVSGIIKEFVSNNPNIIIMDIMAIKEYIDNTAIINIIPYELYYYTLASANARDYAFKLADILAQNGLQYIELKRNYDFSLGIYWKNQLICSIYSINYNDLPPYEIFNTIKYANLDFIRFEIFKIFISPRMDIAKWIPYFQLYNKLPQIQTNVYFDKTRQLDNPEIITLLTKIKDIIDKEHKHILIVGTYAFNLIMNTLKQTDNIIPINYYEVISTNPEILIEKIKKELSSTINKTDIQLNIKQNNTIMKITRHSISYGSYKLIDIFDGSQFGFPRIKIDNLYIGNIHVLLRFFYFGIFVSYKMSENGDKLRNKLMGIISKLMLAYNTIKSPIFDTFQYKVKDIFGSAKNIERDFRINKWKGNVKDRELIYQSYKPRFL